MVGMDRRTENNLRKKEARGSPVGLHEGTGNLQQPVRPTLHSLSTETEPVHFKHTWTYLNVYYKGSVLMVLFSLRLSLVSQTL